MGCKELKALHEVRGFCTAVHEVHEWIIHVVKYFAGISHVAGEPSLTVAQSVYEHGKELWNIHKVSCKLIALSMKYLMNSQTSCRAFKLIPRYGPIYRLLANSRFLQTFNSSYLMSCHTIFQDFMDSSNLFSWFYKLPGAYIAYVLIDVLMLISQK